MQILPEKVVKIKQIKKVQGRQERMRFFSVELLTEKVLKFNKIKEAHNIQAHGRQERMMALSETTTRKNQRSIYHIITKLAKEEL